MKPQPNWQYDEMVQVGTDFSDSAQAEAWDAKREKLGDIKAENEFIIKTLGLAKEHTLIDMGTGTGTLALQAAGACARVYAVDVSPAMLSVARQKADKAGAANIEFHHGGFLTYEHAAGPVDAVVSQAALHHLPDFWKLVAMRRIAGMLKDAGRLYLADVVFSFEIDEHGQVFDNAIRDWTARMGEESTSEIEGHFREEYSTTAWIMEGLLRQAGFRICRANYTEPTFANYSCERQ